MLRLRVGGFRRLDERGKSGRVVGGHVGQNFAIQVYAGLLQAADKLTVGYFSRAAGSADADDPQRTEIALLAPPSDVAIAQRLLDGLLRGPIQLALGEKKARRPFQRLMAVVPAFGSSFDSRHVLLLVVYLALRHCGTCGAVSLGAGFNTESYAVIWLDRPCRRLPSVSTSAYAS